MHPGRWRAVWFALFVCGLGAYLGILIEGHVARAAVVDPAVYGETLTGDGRDPVNTVFLTNDGSAAIGADYHFASSVRWTIVPVRRNASAERWLYLMAEDPQFFSAAGSVRVSVDGSPVGEIHAVTSDHGTTFAANVHASAVLMPPATTIGYRFPLNDGEHCSIAACVISVDGSWTFWHVYRAAVIGDDPRFAAAKRR